MRLNCHIDLSVVELGVFQRLRVLALLPRKITSVVFGSRVDSDDIRERVVRGQAVELG
jgi:hypothetical protein